MVKESLIAPSLTPIKSANEICGFPLAACCSPDDLPVRLMTPTRYIFLLVFRFKCHSSVHHSSVQRFDLFASQSIMITLNI